ncbi:hypothetical protein [Burkholderia pseudomallei]|nr:hypothetical protein [Burkholderia pseudomallei]AJX68036.1 putative lipoprotein [Burkholderia pseudomallei MSHR840]KGC97468.1 putative lipoprotein [Burkholderia pseudomallei]KGS79493.1 putative lipoprotein [Burkholderia pseudomallei MSHR5596]KGV78380.1 putative lipoprotein [Burkholderia pseudomallei MSHR4299]OMZ38819.1 hypothetical protein AQ862_01500 [Burkholderia pseudomallei]
MKRKEKTLPLWAIWLISLVAVIAWCGVHGEPEKPAQQEIRPVSCA